MTTDNNVKTLEVVNDDVPSVKGKFGWATIGKAYIPYLLKNDGTKYVSVRMAEAKVLGSYLAYLNSDILCCCEVKSFVLTEAESKLLTEINLKHSDGEFGTDPFSVGTDHVVKMDDLLEFHAFIEICYNKILLRAGSNGCRCGFVRINNDSVVPYAVKNSQKYVPLFYFEGETDSLKSKAEKFENWDLAYLKFCCKVQGIKNDLFKGDTCLVTSLDDIKSYFPEGTTFHDYWPTINHDLQVARRDTNGNSHSWIRVPPNDISVPPQVIASPVSNRTPPNGAITKVPNQRPVAAPVNNANLPPVYQNAWPNVNNVAVPGLMHPNYQSTNHPIAQQTNVHGHMQQHQPQNLMRMPVDSLSNMAPASRNYMVSQIRPQPNAQYYAPASQNAVLLSQGSNGASQTLVRPAAPNAIVSGSYTPNMNSMPQDTYGNLYGNVQNIGTPLPSMHQMPYLPTVPAPATGSNSNSIATKMRTNFNNATNLQTSNRHPPALTPINNNIVTNSVHNNMPNNVSNMPNNVSNMPSNMPNNVSNMSNNVSNMPNNVSNMPNNVSNIPNSVSNVPNNATNVPNTVSNKRPANSSNGSDIIDLSSPPSSPKIRSNMIMHNNISNRHSPANNSTDDFIDQADLVRIPEEPRSNLAMPLYTMQKVTIKNICVSAINMKPCVYSDLLMTVRDLWKLFFPKVTMRTLSQVLKTVLKVNLYIGNIAQMQVLVENGKCESVNDVVPLIEVGVIDHYHPQLSYTLDQGVDNSVKVKKPRLS